MPYVAKAKGLPWARLAAKVMMGASLDLLGVNEVPDSGFSAVKVPVFPFDRFPGVDVILGPEMRSTGEVMGTHRALPVALAKALMGKGVSLPTEGNVFLSVGEWDHLKCVDIGRSLVSMGFTLFTTRGMHDVLTAHSIDSALLGKISEHQA